MYLRQIDPSKILLALLLLPFLVGCSDKGLNLIPVSGTVTFDGGPPPEHGTIYFIPIEQAETLDGKNKNSRGYATFGMDGKYFVRFKSTKEGLLPGRYLVEIKCSHDSPAPENSYIKPGYKAEELVVPADGGAITKDFDVPRKP